MNRGVIDASQRDRVLHVQSVQGGRFGELASDLGHADSDDVMKALCDQRGVGVIERLTEWAPTPETLASVSAEMAFKYKALPLERDNGSLRVAMADPFDPEAAGVLRMFAGCRIEPLHAPADQIVEAISRHYGSNVTRMISRLDGDDGTDDEERPADLATHLQALAREPTVVNLVNLVIHEAIDSHASDIHVEPFEKTLKVKYRIDGVLHEMSPPPKHLQSAIASRIKIMAGMNIAERFIPQDGHIDFATPHGDVDLRVSTVPTVYGESVVLRILDRTTALIGMERLGLPEPQLSLFRDQLDQPHGIALVTGPTGSGKTTTLYAALNHIYSPSRKILTIEDPVEYRLEGVNQIPVNPKRGLHFADGLRSILRQDPDVIMVGEIRDSETADIAIRSALTGHLVLSTLHTNDALGAIARLIDMGVEPFLVASSLRTVMAQRLVRRVCTHCKQPSTPSEAIVRRLGHRLNGEQTFYRGEGCRECRQTGYSGRLGIFELILVNDDLREAIATRVSSAELARLLDESHIPMWEDGYRKAANGLTTLDEVLRVTQDV